MDAVEDVEVWGDDEGIGEVGATDSTRVVGGYAGLHDGHGRDAVFPVVLGEYVYKVLDGDQLYGDVVCDGPEPCYGEGEVGVDEGALDTHGACINRAVFILNIIGGRRASPLLWRRGVRALQCIVRGSACRTVLCKRSPWRRACPHMLTRVILCRMQQRWRPSRG